MRFLIDKCAGHQIATWLRSLGHQVAESRDRGPDPGDRTILSWAAAEERILVTTDKDFGELVFVQRDPHCGLVRLPQAPWAERRQLMERVLASHVEDLATGAVVTVQGGRIRVSRSTTGD